MENQPTRPPPPRLGGPPPLPGMPQARPALTGLQLTSLILGPCGIVSLIVAVVILGLMATAVALALKSRNTEQPEEPPIEAAAPSPGLARPGSPPKPQPPAVDPLEVKIVRVGMEKLQYKNPYSSSGASRLSDKPYLSIHVHVRNITSAKRVGYRGGGYERGWGPAGTTLQDEHGNDYTIHREGYSTDACPKQLTWEDIDAGQERDDLYVFDFPVAQAKTLTFRIPKGHLDAARDFVRTIDVSAVREAP